MKLTDRQWAALGRLTDKLQGPWEIAATRQTLDALTRRGLAQSHCSSWSGKDKRYKLTDAGRAALDARGCGSSDE